jgi:hypothetical protein
MAEKIRPKNKQELLRRKIIVIVTCVNYKFYDERRKKEWDL